MHCIDIVWYMQVPHVVVQLWNSKSVYTSMYFSIHDLAGGNLHEMLFVEDSSKEPLPEDQALYYIEQILQGVQFLHQNSVLHLNITGMAYLVYASACRTSSAVPFFHIAMITSIQPCSQMFTVCAKGGFSSTTTSVCI